MQNLIEKEEVVAWRDLIHRCNNFLAFLVAHGESALLEGDKESAQKALRAILEESNRLEAELKVRRRQLES